MARKWDTIISYEDRSNEIHTARWRLSGVRTKEGSENTDSGVLWLTYATGGTPAFSLHKAEALGASVASGSGDPTTADGQPENFVKITLAEVASSGLSGTFWIHQYFAELADPASRGIPIQVALCVDEDMDGLWDGLENLPGYDATVGAAEFIRIASQEIINLVQARYRTQLGGEAGAEAWFIRDAKRTLPDLRRIANPGQLRLACANRALSYAIGRSHKMQGDTIYSEQRDFFNAEFDKAMASITLTIKSGSGDNAVDHQQASSVHMARI